MKTKLYTLILALVASISNIYGIEYYLRDVQVDDLYYSLYSYDNAKYYARVTYKSKEEKTNYSTGDTYTVYNERWSITSVNIPSSITTDGDTYPVIGIGKCAFASCSNLTSVTIPNSVTHIYDFAFSGCSNLSSVVIGDSVTNIGLYAFQACYKISSLTIGKSVTYIGTYAFDCKPDTLYWNAINYPSAGNGQNKYYHIGAKKCIHIGNEVTDIPSECFSYSGIETITIPRSVMNIRDKAFANCSNLEMVFLESSSPAYLTVSAFDNVASSLKIIVPCGSLSAYKGASGWKSYSAIIQEPSATAKAVSADNIKGSVSAITSICDTIITATSNYGYHFSQWSDGNTDNPRTIDPTEDVTYTAEFAPNQYTVTLECDAEQGAVDGTGTFYYLTDIEISAKPYKGYYFIKWSDENTSATRTIKVDRDISLTALFEEDLSAIGDVKSDKATVRKELINNQIFILEGDKKYTMQGIKQ